MHFISSKDVLNYYRAPCTAIKMLLYRQIEYNCQCGMWYKYCISKHLFSSFIDICKQSGYIVLIMSLNSCGTYDFS